MRVAVVFGDAPHVIVIVYQGLFAVHRSHRSLLTHCALTFALFLGFSAAVLAQPARKLQPDSLLAERVKHHVKFLAGDDLAGRRTSEPGNQKAAEYIAARFKEAGLAPLPGGDGYFHRFEYLAGIKMGGKNWLVLRHGDDETRLAPGDRYNPLGFSMSARTLAGLAFVGYGITAKEEGYDDYAGIEATGRIVVVMRSSPDGVNPHGSFSRFASFSSKLRNAYEHGAAAVIFINPPSDSTKLVPLTLDRNFTNAELPCVAAFSSIFDGVRDRAGRSIAQIQKAIDMERKPASFIPDGYSAEVAVELELRRAQVPNVVGVLAGTDPKLRDDVIVIGGHFDHLGMGGEGSLHGRHEPAIHHGADDNASGTAGVIELAAHFARAHDNKRTLVFMCYNGEEEGLLGSAAFTARPPLALERVTTMVNMDMIGRLDSSLIVQGTGTSPWWSEMLPKLNAGRFTLKMVEDGLGPSDHSSFYGKNIPVLFFFTGLHSDYHRPTDTWEKVNYMGEARVLAFVADVVRAIDAKKGRPPFTKTRSSTPRSGGFKVYVGTIPDYGYEGKGLRLSGVADGGPAQKAGLQEGDVIVGIDKLTINNIYDYTDALGELQPKQAVNVVFMRGTERKTVSVVLGSR